MDRAGAVKTILKYGERIEEISHTFGAASGNDAIIEPDIVVRLALLQLVSVKVIVYQRSIKNISASPGFFRFLKI